MQDVVTLIQNVGYPIGVSLILMYYVLKLTKEHKEETNRFTEALNKNTLILQQLTDKLTELLNKN